MLIGVLFSHWFVISLTGYILSGEKFALSLLVLLVSGSVSFANQTIYVLEIYRKFSPTNIRISLLIMILLVLIQCNIRILFLHVQIPIMDIDRFLCNCNHNRIIIHYINLRCGYPMDALIAINFTCFVPSNFTYSHRQAHIMHPIMASAWINH